MVTCLEIMKINDVMVPSGVLLVLDSLEQIWGMEGNPTELGHDEPLDGLILTVLSQNTNDRNRDVAFSRIKEVYQDWGAVYEAKIEDLISLMRPAGLANIKAERIKRILRIIYDEFGDFSLKALKAASRGIVEDFLDRMPGVGPKTIACVLVFDLNIPAFPVDTHVARFCRRIGWVTGKTKPEEIQKIMEAFIPSSRFLGAHLNIISHGRGICTARKPECEKCSLRACCDFYLVGKTEK